MIANEYLYDMTVETSFAMNFAEGLIRNDGNFIRFNDFCLGKDTMMNSREEGQWVFKDVSC